MNSKTRKRLYEILRARDGEFCAECRKVGSWSTLCIDHVDNNNQNHALDNLQFLCRSCNTKKNPRGKAKPESRGPEIQPLPSSKEIVLKEKYEPMFREWLANQVMRYERITVQDTVEAGAEVTGASIYTIEKYLRKMCSSAGRYCTSEIDGKKYVELKEWWKPN